MKKYSELPRPYRNLRISFILLLAVLLSGVAGFHFIEGMSFFDSLYMTVITISTVGFQEVTPLGTSGRILAMLIISTGIMIGAYTLGTLLRLLIEGEIQKTFGRRKVERMISSLKDHYIICGYGRIGKLIARELRAAAADFVVVENDLAALEALQKDGFLFIAMDATSEEALMAAGIERAKAIVTALPSDAENVFITLTARGIRPDIYILARASEESSVVKLKRAGATRVDLPYAMGGKRMAHALIRPAVGDFIDLAIMDADRELGLGMEQVPVKPGSGLIGKDLVASNIRKDYGVIIVAIKKHSGRMIFNPAPAEVLEENDILVVLGRKDDLARMDRAVLV